MGFLTEEIAIDLGTANTLIIHNDKVVVDSPSIVAIDRSTNKIIAIGDEASMMHGKTHENIKTIRPLKDGVIADFNASEQMINTLIKSIPTLKKKFVAIKGEGVWSSMVPIMKEDGPSENQYVMKIAKFENAIYNKISASLESMRSKGSE